MSSEQVLVIPRSAFESFGAFKGFHPNNHVHNIGRYLTVHPAEENLAVFMPRDEMETSNDWIQLIPYCMLMCGHDVFSYSRNKKGGEARLHDQFSVGVGGHINNEDHDEEPFMAYLHGTIRELKEEVGLEIPVEALANTALGMLHDPDSPVGRVHLGVLHAIHISPQEMAIVLANAEESMSEPRFTPLADVPKDFGDTLELWSQWSVGRLIELMSKPKPWEDPDCMQSLKMVNLAACELGRSSMELMMQDKGRNWAIGRENVETALGYLTDAMSDLITNGVLQPAFLRNCCGKLCDTIASTQQS